MTDGDSSLAASDCWLGLTVVQRSDSRGHTLAVGSWSEAEQLPLGQKVLMPESPFASAEEEALQPGPAAVNGPLVRLLIADRAPTRLGIRMALEGEVVVCAEAENHEHAIRQAKHHQPDLCLVGRDLAGDALTGVRGICRAVPGTSVVVLAENSDADDLIESVRAGAVGYVPGPLDAERLRRVVHAVRANEAVVPRSMVLELLLELRAAGTGGDGLTTRESQVFSMLRRGHSTAAIAERLEITPVTVRRHISELVHKVGVASRSELIATPPTPGHPPPPAGQGPDRARVGTH